MTTAIGRPKFNLGQILATPGALEALEESGQSVQFFLSRHVRGDWGEVDDEDKLANDQSLLDGSRLLSAYRTLKNERLTVRTKSPARSPVTLASTERFHRLCGCLPVAPFARRKCEPTCPSWQSNREARCQRLAGQSRQLAVRLYWP